MDTWCIPFECPYSWPTPWLFPSLPKYMISTPWCQGRHTQCLSFISPTPWWNISIIITFSCLWLVERVPHATSLDCGWTPKLTTYPLSPIWPMWPFHFLFTLKIRGDLLCWPCFILDYLSFNLRLKVDKNSLYNKENQIRILPTPIILYQAVNSKKTFLLPINISYPQ